VLVVLLGIFIAALWQFRALRLKLAESDERVLELEHDLSASRRMTSELGGKLEAVLSASEDAMLIVDSSGSCKLINEQAKVFFGGLPPNSSLLAATQSAELDALLQKAQRVAPSEETVAGEVVLRAFGDRRMQTLISRIEPASFGAPNSYLILLRDITDLRRLETVRRDFVANVSHELRTPLSSIKAMSETLLGGALEDGEVAKHFLETIIEETDRLVRLSADLLDLSRIELRPVIKVDSDIADLIDDVVARLDSQRDKAGLTLSVDIERPLMAPCDTDEIAQVLVNLLDNAIKYTPRGGSVEVRAHLRKNRVGIEVTDTGIGILQQDIPRLFERFYRTDKARSRQSGGTGLGLSIVKHIVERHGGELWVRSEYNRGSTFGFTIPRPRDDSSIAARIERIQSDWEARKRGEYVAVSSAASTDHGPESASSQL
jgi:two-component system phosphate regulon sensor histidine kinase PhoR